MSLARREGNIRIAHAPVRGEFANRELRRACVGPLLDRTCRPVSPAMFSGVAVAEAFEADWRAASDIFEPGHQLEWAGILGNYSKLTGDDVLSDVDALIAFAERYGVYEKRGLVANEAREVGSPHGGSRAWPNSERIKGHLARFELSGVDPRAAVATSLEALFQHHLGDVREGLWLDRFDFRGAITIRNLSGVDAVPSGFRVQRAASPAAAIGETRASAAPHDPAGVTAVVLAGGRGTRIRGLYPDVPKPMIEVAGKPFLHWVTAHLVRAGVRDFVYSTGYLGDQIADWCGNEDFPGVRRRACPEAEPLGTGGGLLNCLDICRDEILTINGDSLCVGGVSEILQLRSAARSARRCGRLSGRYIAIRYVGLR